MTDQPKPYLLDELQLTEAELEAERIIAEETEKERLAFVPHIRADFCFVGPCRRRPVLSCNSGSTIPNIPIPSEFSKLPKEQQIQLLRPLIQEHFARYGSQITDYGERIDGYRVWLTLEDFDECEFYLFQTDGCFIPDEPAPCPKPTTRRAKHSRESNPTTTKSRRR